MIPPKGIIELYRRAQVDSNMDNGTYFEGTDRYGMDRIIEGMAKICNWHLPPRMTREQQEQLLRDEGREYDIECLME